MRTILIHSLTGNNNRIFEQNVRDGCNDPMLYLRDRLSQCGYSLKTADNNTLDDCEWVFFLEGISIKPYSGWRGFARRLRADFQGKPRFRNLYDECVNAGMQSRMALFLLEPPSVSTDNWDAELHKLFPLIFTWHDSYIDGRKFYKIHLPQISQFPCVPKIPFLEKKLLTNISMNKYSRHPRELYSVRRTAIRYFEQNQAENFDLYGVGWNQPANILQSIMHTTRHTYPSYRGIVINKSDILPYYRFSLCYENIRDEPGYVTEKIFDCMRAGCVPIYLGAPNITDYVDADAFIDRRKYNSDAELEAYIVSIPNKEYQRLQEAMHDYLISERFAKFLPPAYADTIIRTLHL